MMAMDLSLVPTEALVDALAARYDAMVFYGVKATGGYAGITRWRYTGPIAAALGLTVLLQQKIARHLEQHEGPAPVEDR